MNSPALARTALLVVLLHTAIAVVHGRAHSAIGIDMAAWQNNYIVVVILLLPILAAAAIWFRGTGYLVLCASMLGALLFGGYYHFVAAGMDNVASVGGHAMGSQFRVTAVLLAISEAAGVLVGLAGFTRSRPERR